MKNSPWLTLPVLLALVFTLATCLAPRVAAWSRTGGAGGLMGMLLGDSRQLFANQFFTQADAYFHAGCYPSIFDQNAAEQKEAILACQNQDHDHDHDHSQCEEEELKKDFLGQPKDWIDAFGRNFRITRHNHLNQAQGREILPWLRMAADLNPHKIEVYTVGAFFLFDNLKRPEPAAEFLREGLHHNPGNCELLFALGRIYWKGFHDASRARNVWNFAVEKYQLWPAPDRDKNQLIYLQLAGNLAQLEEEEGNYLKALAWLESMKATSPSPEALQAQINAVRRKISAKQP